MKLIIVESPTKAKTINTYAGKDFKVISSKGHIIDLPQKSLGIDIEHNFKPEFKPIPSKKSIIKNIQRESKKADEIFIATDPDREGEAIAYHIHSIIDNKNSKRVLFYEITKKGIQKGINNPIDINYSLVQSQYARRILDRIVGYKVSPFLWSTVRKGLSAGRVQSVALRLICEKEESIENFKPEKYYKIKGTFCKDKQKFITDLIKYNNKKVSEIKDIESKIIEKELKSGNYTVIDFKEENKKQNPLPPFITSTLQQSASNIFNFTAKRTIKIAQSLYEGKDIGGTLTGLITYMRTDSTRLSDDAVNSMRVFILNNFGKDYLPNKKIVYKKSKSSQDAHEAIRPTDINIKPDDIKQFLTKEEYKLYSLIWARALACQMNSAIFSVTTIEIGSNGHIFKGIGNKLLFDGFLKIYPYSRSRDMKNIIPKIKISEKVDLKKLDIKLEQTKPSARYTEATLVKTLETKGIGRPSTYASIIDILLRRDYVIKEKKNFRPTDLGKTVNKVLVKYFANIFNVNFTAEMEKELDLIEENKLDSKTLLSNFYKEFSQTLDNANSNSKSIKKDLEEKTDKICEKCGSPMIIKWGKYGKFLACSNYPKCTNAKPLEEEEKLDEKCPKCGKDLIIKTGRFGRFIACSDYPKCKFTKPLTTGIKCPECHEGELIEKQTSRRKIFWGCSNYPKCKYATWNKPVDKKCPECGYSIMTIKNNQLVCPKCNHKEEINNDN